MPLAAGTRLGPYEIRAPIGAGGMGEVYRAHDGKLGRDVAIKVLPEELATNEERVARFEREAKLLASLNHPNIAAIYGLEHNALVLELVDGPTLAERIREGPIPFGEALPIARQIADALESGHEAGIIHRDLKPANVKLKEDGTVKVLDYGLAKALEGGAVESGNQELSMSPTLTRQGTELGVILGTAAYMSPEQAKGKRLDKRTDVWSFGVVLYEMLTGKRAFAGEDVSDTLAFVLTREPDWSALSSDVPASLRTYLMRCLEKDPRKRIRDIGDVRLALDGAFDVASAAPAPAASSRSKLPWVAAVVASLATGLGVWSVTRPEPPQVNRFAYELPAGHQLRNRGRAVLAVSPDGRRFVYNTTDGVYLRSLDALDPRLLPGTAASLTTLFFSPDGQSIGYVQGGQLKRLALSGGAPVVVASVEGLTPLSAHWAADDRIYFRTSEGILRVPANGGPSELVLPAVDGEVFDAPQLLPGGDVLLFTASPGRAWDESSIVVASLDTKERTVVLQGGSDALYVSSGHLVYALGDGLFAVAFDVRDLRVTSGPVSVVEGVERATNASSANYAVSNDGTLFFLAARGAEAIQRLSWVDRTGRAETIEPIPAKEYETPRLSPDGKRLLVVANGALWIYDLESGRESRLITDGATQPYADWTPSGSEVAYTSASATENVWIQPADGSGKARPLTGLDERVHFDAWAPDGRTFSAHQHSGVGSKQLMVHLDGEEAKPETWLERSFATSNAVFSPDGRYVALVSGQTGQNEVYIYPFPGPGGQTPVSVGGGVEPAWAPSGEIFYRRPEDYMMMAVEVSTDPILTVGPPRELFPGSSDPGGSPRARYAVTADGERFLMSADLLASGENTGSRPRIVIVQNWVEELEERVPVR